jgi:hypothetical protein
MRRALPVLPANGHRQTGPVGPFSASASFGSDGRRFAYAPILGRVFTHIHDQGIEISKRF